MRIYLPATLPALAAVLNHGEAGPAPLRAFAVTPALREAYASGDLEELEYVAMTHAARASLRMLAEDPAAPRRRVVLAVDVPDGQVVSSGGFDDPTLVQVTVAVPVAWVAAGHVDSTDAVPDIGQAITAVPDADAGDIDAQFLVDGAEGHELLWYATQELTDLPS